MGREIRRVPPEWEHPKENGQYKPLLDDDYEYLADKWARNCGEWSIGTHLDQMADPSLVVKYPWYWEWAGDPPCKDDYRPQWDPATITCYQIYETVSKGTPVSPVFATEDEMIGWLVAQGHSEAAAQAFIQAGYASTMAIGQGRVILTGIDAMEFLGRKES